MDKISFGIDLKEHKIVGKQSVRVTRKGFSYIPKTTRDFQKVLIAHYLAATPPSTRSHIAAKLYEQPLRLRVWCEYRIAKSWSKTKKSELIFKPATTKPDCDNIAKMVGDTFNGVIYKDDSQIYDMHVTKVWSDQNAIWIEFDWSMELVDVAPSTSSTTQSQPCESQCPIGE